MKNATDKDEEALDEEAIARALLEHVRAFIKKQHIHCVETVYQSDRVILNAYDFIAGCCEIAGYVELDDD